MTRRKQTPRKRRGRGRIVRKWVRIVGRGIYFRDFFGERSPTAEYAVVDDRSVAFRLHDGRRVEAPISWFPRLKHATPVERNDWRLTMDGRAVMWNALDFGIAVVALLEGDKAHEPAKVLRKWLAGLARTRRKKEKK